MTSGRLDTLAHYSILVDQSTATANTRKVGSVLDAMVGTLTHQQVIVEVRRHDPKGAIR